MATKTKSTITLILKVTVAVALIGYLVKAGHLDPKDLWRLMTVQNVVLALALVGANIFLAAWRWVILLRARGFQMPLMYGFSLYLIGIFFNHALPGSVGGDVVRGYYLVTDNPGRKLEGILSIFIDRILGLYSFFLLALIAVAWDYDFVSSHEQIRWVALLAFLVFLGMTAFFIVVFSQRLSHLLGLPYLEKKIPAVHRVILGFVLFGRKRETIILSVLVSLFSQIFALIFFYQFGMMSGETDISVRAVMFVVPMGFLVTAVPIAPAGIGVGQVAFTYLFQAYLQNNTSFGATAVTALQLTTICWALIGAALYLRRKKPHDLEQMEAVSETAVP